MVHLASVVVGILGSWVDTILYITYPPFEPRDILRSLKSNVYYPKDGFTGNDSFFLQGVSHWRVQSKLALTGRLIDDFLKLWWSWGLRGLYIWVSSTSFQKCDIGWPQQPPTKKVLKFKMIFPDSTKIFFSKI